MIGVMAADEREEFLNKLKGHREDAEVKMWSRPCAASSIARDREISPRARSASPASRYAHLQSPPAPAYLKRDTSSRVRRPSTLGLFGVPFQTRAQGQENSSNGLLE